MDLKFGQGLVGQLMYSPCCVVKSDGTMEHVCKQRRSVWFVCPPCCLLPYPHIDSSFSSQSFLPHQQAEGREHWQNVCTSRREALPTSGLKSSRKMVHYSLDPENPTKSCKSRGSNLLVHFKNIRETAQAIKDLKDVTLQKQCMPLHRYSGGVGRSAPAKQRGWMQGQWPKESAEFLLHMLENAEYCSVEGFRCRFLGHWAHLGEQKPQDAPAELAELLVRWTPHELTHELTLRWLLLKMSTLFLKQKGRWNRRKRYTGRNWRSKTYGLGISSA